MTDCRSADCLQQREGRQEPEAPVPEALGFDNFAGRQELEVVAWGSAAEQASRNLCSERLCPAIPEVPAIAVRTDTGTESPSRLLKFNRPG